MPVTRLLLTLVLTSTAAAPGLAQQAEDENGWDVSSPPGDSRRVNIDTDRGTWMSLDVSPDGRTLRPAG